MNDPGELAGILADLARSPERRQSLARAALQRVERYTLRRNAERTEAVYNDLFKVPHVRAGDAERPEAQAG